MTISRQLVCLVFLVLTATHADAAVRFVATTGVDTNACTRTAPCRTIQKAHDVAAAGDEIQILNSGEFGPTLAISKSITISADGVSATLFNPGPAPNAIRIDAAGAAIVLRGLSLSGGWSGETGILIINAAAVHIERCTVERFGEYGIHLNVAATDVFIAESVSRDNFGWGAAIVGNGPAASLTVDSSRFENNGVDGLYAIDIASTITRSIANGNERDGIHQSADQMNALWTTAADNGESGFQVSGGGELTVRHSIARGNGAIGLLVQALNTARIADSNFTYNGIGIQNGGLVLTRGNNTVAGNTTNIVNTGNIDPLPGT
jgi:hypothetical protein